MALALLLGPANAGKVARLLDRYLAAADREPFLVVPNRGDVEAIERDLLARAGCLLGGTIGTFDDVFARVLELAGRGGPVATDLQRSLAVAQAVRTVSLNGLGASARTAGFTEALADALADLETGLVDPEAAGGDLGRLFEAYREELERFGLRDRAGTQRLGAELAASELAAWDGAPVFAYGFEDLTGAQWRLLEALAGRADVTVSLPYEPGRIAFDALRPTAESLAALAAGRIEELPAQGWYETPALAHLERALFEGGRRSAPPLGGAVRFLEAAGSRAALELVGDEILSLLRGGTPAEEIAVVVPSLDRHRASLESAFAELDIPYALEGVATLGRLPLGRALVAMLRFAWLGGGRRELFAFLRSPYSGLARTRADFVEGRLRGRAVSAAGHVEEETLRLLGHGIPALERARSGDPLEAARRVLDGLLRAAYGLESPPAGEAAKLDLRSHDAAVTALDELAHWRELGGAVGPETVLGALDRAPVRLSSPREFGRVAVVDLLRVRTRRFQAVFVLGLEEGTLPRRPHESPFLPDERRAELEAAAGVKLLRPDSAARDRYLFYTACTRAWSRLTLVREAASDDGRPREPSPFWLEVRRLFAPDEVVHWTRRRPLSALSWELERAPTERERLRSASALAARDEREALALARANGWERRIERALSAFARPTALTSPAVLEELAATTRFSVTDLEQFVACSSMWLFTRVVDPREIDAEADARLRGGVAHAALYRFYSALPKRLGAERVERERLDETLVLLRECLAEALESQVRIELGEVARLELEQTLQRDLEQFVRQEAELELPLVPRRLELGFGTDRAAAELQRGLDLGGFTVSGKIDRIDVEPFGARGIVQDYKSGVAFSAAQIDEERRLQIPLYILALRDLVGIEPLGGLYRSLSGAREARGLVRASSAEELPGLKRGDYLDEDEFWAKVDRARETARGAVARIRDGDVRHDPRGGRCPSWCQLWSMCRIART